MNQQELRTLFYQHQDSQYQSFFNNIANTKYPIIGVRLPILRSLCKQYKNELDVTTYLFETYEDVMFYGLYICSVKRNEQQFNTLFEPWCDVIDSWVYTDSFAKGYRYFTQQQLDHYYSCLSLDHPFKIRAILNIVLVARKYIPLNLLEWLQPITSTAYYVEMMIAWMIQINMVDYPNETMQWTNLYANQTIKKMALRKCLDSYAIDKALKQELRKMWQS